jgi:hypothetical protein
MSPSTSSSTVTPRGVRRLMPAARAGAFAALVLLLGAEDDCFGEDEPEPSSTACADACALEASCGFRDEDDCLAGCPADGASLNPALDECFAAAASCLESAACACDAGCARVDECAEAEPDPTCVSSCDAIIEQETQQTYVEQRCRIESSCEDLAACSSVSG